MTLTHNIRPEIKKCRKSENCKKNQHQIVKISYDRKQTDKKSNKKAYFETHKRNVIPNFYRSGIFRTLLKSDSFSHIVIIQSHTPFCSYVHKKIESNWNLGTFLNRFCTQLVINFDCF